eukprot:g7791.t2
MQLCCRATALRASFLQQHPAAAVAAHAAATATATRGGFLGPSTTACPSGRGLHTREPAAAAAAAGISTFSGRPVGATARPALTTTRALVAGALLLSSSSSTAVVAAGGATTRFGGCGGGRRRGAHSTPSIASSAVASDATVAEGASAPAAGEGAPLPPGGGARSASGPKLPVVFVLGGPGSGKGTQCERLAKEYGYVHLSAGELLREERASGSSDGQLIDEYIREGRIVPVAISLGLLRKAMEASGPHARFLIDGFPRNSDNVEGWDAIMGDVADVRSVLFLYCPEGVLEQRLLSRGKSSGRTDDNAETAKRRFQTYVETTLPVVEQYEQAGLVARVDGNQDIESVFRDVVSGLRPVQEKEVLDANRLAVEAICEGDLSAYAELCASEMTEQLGGDLAFAASDGKSAFETPVMLRPRVRVLSGGAAAVACCERPRGAGLTGGGGDGGTMVQETRVWEMQGGRWRCVHCHTSPGVEGKKSAR